VGVYRSAKSDFCDDENWPETDWQVRSKQGQEAAVCTTSASDGSRPLGDTWADTTIAHCRLMLTVLGGLAEFERELIRVRTGEGRTRAKARGVKMGRPPKMTPHQTQEALNRRDAGEPMRDIAESYNVSHSTISRVTP